MKEKNFQKLWIFDLGTQEGKNIPIWIIVGFQHRDREDSQILNNDTFYRPSVTNTQRIIANGNNPDSGIIINYDDDDYSQAYGQFKEAFRALTKDDILKPYITDHDFRSSNEGNNVGNNLYVFDIR